MTPVSDPLRVAIVDDEPIARSRMRRLLDAFGPDVVRVVLECADTESLLRTGPRSRLDLIFLDVEMPGDDGLSAITRWPSKRPQVVVVTAHSAHALRAFQTRAIDYLTKPVCERRLAGALERGMAYKRAASDTLPQGPIDPLTTLTTRQIEILTLIAERRSNKEIGRTLDLSPFTVRNHLSSLYRLFGVDGRRDLLVRALEAGLSSPGRA